MSGLIGLLVVSVAGAQSPARGAPEIGGHVVEQGRHGVVDLGRPGPIEAAAPIVNGAPVQEARDEIVALGFLSETGFLTVFCSGSLIHPEWVLTAAHCIIPASDGPVGSERVVMWGNQSTSYTETIPWAESYREPRYSDLGDIIHDVGLIRLAEPKQNPVLMVLNDATVDLEWVGTQLDFYGFGVTGDTAIDSGIKRTTTIPIDDVTPYDISTYTANSNVCFGDSGGPSTYEGPDGPEQVGVNSTVDPGCIGGAAESARVDIHITWFQEYVPELILDYADLPSDEPEEPIEDGYDRRWDDLGAEHVDGLDGLFSSRSPVSSSGCRHGGGSHRGAPARWASLLLLGVAYLAARGRVRRSAAGGAA